MWCSFGILFPFLYVVPRKNLAVLICGIQQQQWRQKGGNICDSFYVPTACTKYLSAMLFLSQERTFQKY
jgi:hypothetical protein